MVRWATRAAFSEPNQPDPKCHRTQASGPLAGTDETRGTVTIPPTENAIKIFILVLTQACKARTGRGERGTLWAASAEIMRLASTGLTTLSYLVNPFQSHPLTKFLSFDSGFCFIQAVVANCNMPERLSVKCPTLGELDGLPSKTSVVS